MYPCLCSLQHRIGPPKREVNFIKLLLCARPFTYVIPFNPQNCLGQYLLPLLHSWGNWVSDRYLAQGCKTIVNTYKVFTTCQGLYRNSLTWFLPMTPCGRCYCHHSSLQRWNPGHWSVLMISPKFTQPASDRVRVSTKAFWDLDSVSWTTGYASTRSVVEFKPRLIWFASPCPLHPATIVSIEEENILLNERIHKWTQANTRAHMYGQEDSRGSR